MGVGVGVGFGQEQAFFTRSSRAGSSFSSCSAVLIALSAVITSTICRVMFFMSLAVLSARSGSLASRSIMRGAIWTARDLSIPALTKWVTIRAFRMGELTIAVATAASKLRPMICSMAAFLRCTPLLTRRAAWAAISALMASVFAIGPRAGLSAVAAMATAVAFANFLSTPAATRFATTASLNAAECSAVGMIVAARVALMPRSTAAAARWIFASVSRPTWAPMRAFSLWWLMRRTPSFAISLAIRGARATASAELNPALTNAPAIAARSFASLMTASRQSLSIIPFPSVAIAA